MNLTAQAVRGLPLPADAKTAPIDGASLAYVEDVAPLTIPRIPERAARRARR